MCSGPHWNLWPSAPRLSLLLPALINTWTTRLPVCKLAPLCFISTSSRLNQTGLPTRFISLTSATCSVHSCLYGWTCMILTAVGSLIAIFCFPYFRKKESEAVNKVYREKPGLHTVLSQAAHVTSSKAASHAFIYLFSWPWGAKLMERGIKLTEKLLPFLPCLSSCSSPGLWCNLLSGARRSQQHFCSFSFFFTANGVASSNCVASC